jgi:hypothetical protein
VDQLGQAIAKRFEPAQLSRDTGVGSTRARALQSRLKSSN